MNSKQQYRLQQVISKLSHFVKTVEEAWDGLAVAIDNFNATQDKDEEEKNDVS